MGKNGLSESQALRILKTSDIEVIGKVIKIKEKGLSGLRACGAIDALKNYHGYTIV